ncbi:MAG: DUF6285 domain-containing protein [Actinomycetota bacterium]|nr:DUF6285 domain-containing protein [Actinomycetota bacterium]
MKYRPTDAELLDAVAELLEGPVLAAVPGGLGHQVRVAANLCRILQRQQEVEPAALERERHSLLAVLGGDPDGAPAPPARSVQPAPGIGELPAVVPRSVQPAPGIGELPAVAELRAELDRRLRARDPSLDRRAVWAALVATARDDLATAKPGYDAWEQG